MQRLPATLSLALVLLVVSDCWAQLPRTSSLKIPRLTASPTLEDFLSMKPTPAWDGKLAVVNDFRQWRPGDGTPSTQKTVAYLGYDNKNLYVIFVCFDTEPGKIRGHLTRRDEVFGDDFVDVWLDTFNDHRRAYEFLVNPLGVQEDGIDDETNFTEDFSFDTVWYSRGKLTPQGYVVWIALPFKSLRFSNADVQTWGIVLQRDITRNFEKTFWPRITRQIEGIDAQSAEVHGLENISAGRNMQFIPYGLFRAFRGLDLRDPNAPRFTARSAKVDGGLDSKFILKDSLVLDLTVEPDFSQVESDQPQVTVSQRFEVFFPEKRPFFLENASYFTTPINLFFTRRIANPQFGARLTGKIGPYSIGALAADDRAPGLMVPDNDPLAGKRAHFGIVRLSRDVLKNSSLGLIYTDREFDGASNRVGGLDGHFKLSKTLTTSFQGVESSTRNTDGTYLAGPAFEFDVNRSSRNLNGDLHYTGRSDGFRTLPGFDPQPDIHNVTGDVSYTFWPKENKYIQDWGPEMNVYRFYDHEGNRINWGYIPTFQLEFQRQTRVAFAYAQEEETLRPRDFTILTHNVDFVRNTKQITFRSAYFRQMTVFVDYRWGRRINYASAVGQPPYLARRNSVELDLGVRPISRLQIDNTYLLFRLGDVTTRAPAFNDHIIRSKWNYQFTRELSARFILQYNALIGNPALTSLAPAKNFNADFLITYLVHPGTAVYVGYNSNLENFDRFLLTGPNGLLRTRNGFINDDREFFVKVSYFLRF